MVDEQQQEQAPTSELNGARKGGTPTREYVVLESVAFEDEDGEYWSEVHRVEARNGTNALRKAFKALREKRAGEQLDEATLVVIPSGQWKPTPVRAKKRESITVDIG